MGAATRTAALHSRQKGVAAMVASKRFLLTLVVTVVVGLIGVSTAAACHGGEQPPPGKPFWLPTDCTFDKDSKSTYCEKLVFDGIDTFVYTVTETVPDATCASGERLIEKTIEEDEAELWYATFDKHNIAKACTDGNEVLTFVVLSVTVRDLGCAT
jgi:hypothetical protein